MLTGNAIIIVVDRAESRSVFKKDLTKLGYSFVLEASDMDEAMTKIEEASNSGTPVSLVLWAWSAVENQTSCMMAKFRGTPFLKATPIIMLVKERELSQALISASAFINGYLVKPHTLEILKNSLPMALANIS